jgi:hypothetical protein
MACKRGSSKKGDRKYKKEAGEARRGKGNTGGMSLKRKKK